MVDSVLVHHGIKGMKWGMRKSESKGSGEHAPSADHITAMGFKNRAKAGGVKTLSNDELQKLVNRMNLEKQHRDLAGQAPTSFEKGHNHVKKVLKVGKTLQDIYNMANSPAGKAATKLVKTGLGA